MIFSNSWRILGGVFAAGLVFCALPAAAGSWTTAHSDHFVVNSDGSAAVARLYAQKLEAYHYTLYALYQAKNGEVAQDMPRLEIFLLEDRRDIRQVRPDYSEYVAGLYAACIEGTVAYSTYSHDVAGTAGTRISREKSGYDFATLFHEYAHHFMRQNYVVPLPAWYVEGFAEYFMTMSIDGRDITIGAANQDRYSDLSTRTWLNYADILRGNVTYRSESERLTFYAQSWLLTHYIQTSPERLKTFAAYVDEVNGGADAVTAFESRFGIKIADLPAVLKTYLSKGVPAVSFTLKTMPEPVITIKEQPRSAEHLLLWQSVLKTCPPQSYLPELAGKIQTEASGLNDRLAQLTLSRSYILTDKPDMAAPLLDERLKVDAQDAEAHYLMGRVQYANSLMGHPDAAINRSKARASFAQAYRLDPLYAPNLYYISLAQAGRADKPTTTAVDAAVAASNLAPSVEAYAFHAARLLVESGRNEDAIVLLTAPASDPHDKSSATRARSIIAALKAGKTTAEILSLF